MLKFSSVDKETEYNGYKELVLITECLCSMQYAKCFTLIVPLIFMSNPLCKYYHYFHFWDRRNGGPEKLCNLPKVTRLESGRGGNWDWSICCIH